MGGVGVALQDNQGGEYHNRISEAIFLTKRIVAGNPAVMGGDGVVLMENQAGRSSIITVLQYILINSSAPENAEGGQRRC